MNTEEQTTRNDLWTKIEQEKSMDTWIRRICFGAWTTTFLIYLCYAVLIIIQVSGISEDALGRGTFGLFAPEIIELISITIAFSSIGSIAFGVAVISTIALFLRMRSSSLRDIRMRLETLEEMIVSGRGIEKE
ncbi:hypothetical protein NC796_08475 [Aliifodinibius sp. S!AR15-10]|uniref:hypothetical protein n=1 Tax=Aliifodinibius sp. S!AR15-10 TaxID=2950437 RepID=UPI0028600697|nr:hypothetical protein [Aliifodinibius sp. S!AR15-10]MDR8391169.1 hypothetical protein [Aliifodinibius sp. S!AR15-10]